jgi:hypothetical protein
MKVVCPVCKARPINCWRCWGTGLVSKGMITDEMIERAARAMAELHLPQFGWLDLDPADHENWKILARVGIEAALRFREADSDCCLGESTTGYAGSI